MVLNKEYTMEEMRNYIKKYIETHPNQHSTNAKRLTLEFYEIKQKIKLKESELTRFHGISIRIGKALKEIEKHSPNLVSKISQRTYIINQGL